MSEAFPTAFGQAESLLGEALRGVPSLRDRMLLETKAGVAPPTPYNSTTRYLLDACDASLQIPTGATLPRDPATWILRLDGPEPNHRPDANRQSGWARTDGQPWMHVELTRNLPDAVSAMLIVS
jgi:hypothetical protein